MAKKTENNPKPGATQKEYGRRPYVSPVGYVDQMRRIPDKLLFDRMAVKQSEFKKPYRADVDYPEMEYWLPPPPGIGRWGFDMPWSMQNPDPDFPEHYYIDPEFEDEPLPGFLGCEFYWPLTPSTAGPGDVVYGKIQRRDDPVVSIATEGPITVLSTVGELSKCVSTYRGSLPSSPECRVVARIDDDIGEFAVANVILTTATGRTCNSFVLLQGCLETTTLEWDDETSASSVDQDGSCTVAVTGTDTVGPFSWSVAGSGFTLDNASTAGLTNTLNADATACGIATITVTDACGNEATGQVKCTTGAWNSCDTWNPDDSDYYCSDCGTNLGDGYLYSPDNLFRAQGIPPGDVFVGCGEDGGSASSTCGSDVYDIASTMGWTPTICISARKAGYFWRWGCS